MLALAMYISFFLCRFHLRLGPNANPISGGIWALETECVCQVSFTYQKIRILAQGKFVVGRGGGGGRQKTVGFFRAGLLLLRKCSPQYPLLIFKGDKKGQRNENFYLEAV